MGCVKMDIADELKRAEKDEPILSRDNKRWTIYPIQYDDVWDMFKKSEASFWTTSEVDLEADLADWNNKLTDQERFFIKHVLAFFAGADGVVIENLAQKFCAEVQIPEARAFYGFQMMMENVHSEMYALLIDSFIRDPAEKDALFRATTEHPAVVPKAQWALKWISDDHSFAERLVAFAAVEGILFSASFCAIYWLKKRGLMPGLCFSNELIARDEGLHTEFACLLYSKLERPLPAQTVLDIVVGAVDAEREFVKEALKCKLIGMNEELMMAYVEFVADRLLVSLGVPKHFESCNPFPWMEIISLQGKTNFFERRVGEYQKAHVMIPEARVFALDEDF